MSGWVGKTIGNYRIEGSLGLGGMGRVFRAVHIHIHRVAAIKVLHEQFAVDPTFQARFLREAQAAAALHHPNIVDVIDFNQHDGTFYLVMEYVPDGSLRTLLKEYTDRAQLLPLATGIDLIRQAAEALDYAHRTGMVHRDIKPDNLLLRRDPESGDLTVKVGDFGLARLGDGSVLTAEGQAMGTPSYMSPEQCQGIDLDGRSDIYSLGVVLYEVATGAVPFPMKSLTDAIYKHIYVVPPSPQEVRPDLPEALNDIILRCLAKDPADRFATAGELAAALSGLLRQQGRGDWLQPTLFVPAVPVEPLVVTLDSGEVPLTPGEVSLLTVSIANRGLEPVEANISIEGVPSAWVASPPRDVKIAPGAEISGPLRIEVPADAGIDVREYPVVVRASVKDNPAIRAMATTRLRITQAVPAPPAVTTPPAGGSLPPESLPPAEAGAGDPSETPRWLVIAAVVVLVLAVAGIGYGLLASDDNGDDEDDVAGNTTATQRSATATNGSGSTATPTENSGTGESTATEVVIGQPVETPTEPASATDTPDAGGEATKTQTPILPGEFIMFTTGRNLDDPAGTLDIYVMDPDGANQRPLISEPDDDWLAALSPDRTRVAWVSRRHGNHQLYLANVDGTDVRRLTTSAGDDLHPLWAPDGVHLLFVRNEDGDDEFYVLNVDNGNLVRLTDNDAYDGFGAWSPDGTRIAGTSGRDGNNEIYISDGTLRDAAAVRLTNDPANDFNPVWSPDSTRIAFVSNRFGSNDLFVMPVSGGQPTRLTFHENDEIAPAWSPDGSRIAFCRQMGDHAEIVVINADGSGEQVLAINASQNDPDVTWSPDSTRIAYLSEGGGNYDIWTVALDGSPPTQLTDAPGNDANLSWIGS